MQRKAKEAMADILMSLTLIEAALASFQETIDRERELMRAAIKESEVDA